MWDRIKLENIIRQVSIAQPTPACYQHPALPRMPQCLQHDVGDFLWLAVAHAAEANVNGQRARLEEINEVSRRSPVRFTVQEPITGDVLVVIPITGFGNHGRAVAIQGGKALL